MNRSARLAVTAGIVVALAPQLSGTTQQMPALGLESLTGRDSFEFYCASCHGQTGKGDGPVASALKQRPGDLTTLARRNDGLFPSDRVLAVVTGKGRPMPAHGSSDMPVWGPIFRALDPSEPRVAQRIENIVAHIEALQAPSSGSKSLGAMMFRTYCASCHGASGRGDGPVADQFRRTPPDLTKYSARNGGVFPGERVNRIIDGRDVPAHGDREMPVWGDAFRTAREGLTAGAVKARTEAIVRYLREIQERAG